MEEYETGAKEPENVAEQEKQTQDLLWFIQKPDRGKKIGGLMRPRIRKFPRKSRFATFRTTGIKTSSSFEETNSDQFWWSI